MKNEQIKPKRTCQQSEEVVDRDKVKEIPFYLKKYPVTKEELLLKARQTGKTEDMSSTEWQLYQARQTGKTEAMIQSMVYQLKNNENVGVAGCKDPAHILKRLTELGVSAEATVMSYWREPLDDSMLPGEQIDTGYLFQVKPPKINDSIYDIFDIDTYYHNGNEVMYEGNVWVYSEDNGRPLVSVGIYPGTGNGWKVKKS